MSYRKFFVPWLVVCLLVCRYSTARAQTTPPTQLLTPRQEQKGPVQPDNVAARKAAVQARLEALGEPDPQKKDQEETQAMFAQILETLTVIEETLQKYTTFTTQLAELPQRLRELEAKTVELAAHSPSNFPEVSDQLRDEYQAQLQTTQAEMQELLKQTVAGEVRIANIPKELEQRAQDGVRLEKDLLAERSAAAKLGAQPLTLLRAELLDWQLQLQRVEVNALQAERDWLIKRVPLQDALLKVAQARLRNLRQDLDTIKQALGQTIQQEQAALSNTAASIVQQLEQTRDPTEALVLGIDLEMVEIRTLTADYRQQLNDLSDEVLAQEKQNARLKQNVDRLAALVEKYTSGGVIAPRLLVIFERLQRERARYRDTPVRVLQEHLRVLNEQLFTLDDQLYEFDGRAETTLADLTLGLPTATPQQSGAIMAEARQLLDEQKAALRNQQQTLAALVQEVTKLLALHSEYRRQLEESYLFALNKIFWLRDGEPLTWAVGQNMLAGAVATAKRLDAFVRTELVRLWTNLADAPHLWLFTLLVFLALPGVVYKAHKRLQVLVDSFLVEHARREELPGIMTTTGAVLRSAIWPAYIVLLAWLYGRFLAQSSDQPNLALALVSGLQISALVLWVGVLGHHILRRNGWGQYFWGLNPELCRFLRRTVRAGCLAALVCLVPRHILLTAPGDPEITASSLALARLLLLTFQAGVFALVVIVGRRGSLLMQIALADSQQKDGRWWRLWPFVHLALLGGLLTIMTLDVLGYRYAAEFLWFRGIESLSVVLALPLFLMVLVQWLLHRLRNSLSATLGETEEIADRYLTVVRLICSVLLVLLAVGIILELWGVSILWLLTLPLASQILAQVAVVALVVGLTIVVIRVSRTLTDYLLQPKTTRQGVTTEVSRQRKTLVPLVQTLIRVGVIFVAALVILERLGIATGPVLAGVGIFGLAVGFASQSLIKDVINGLFILFEDSLSIGDIVMLRGTGGQVEKFTLRAVTLRDLSGNVHVIPNSSFDMVTNLTKEYSRYLLDLGVAHREDVDTVIGILQEIDEGMRADPEFAKDMLEPLEVLGLDRFQDSAMIIRARLKTRPIQQWRIGREFQRRMKKVFDERGIEIPVPHRKLYWGIPKEGSQPPIHVAMENHQSMPRESAQEQSPDGLNNKPGA